MDETLKQFKRDLFDAERRKTSMGTGSIGGKAAGLIRIDEILSGEHPSAVSSHFPVNIPAFSVLRTDVFDAFVEQNGLGHLRESDASDADALRSQVRSSELRR